MTTFMQSSQVDRAIKMLRQHLDSKTSGLRRAFQLIDTDRSNNLSVEEFKVILKDCGIILPPHILEGVINEFDLNGDGTISIPEFMAFMSGDQDRMDILREAPSIPQEPQKPTTPMHRDYSATVQQRLYGQTRISEVDHLFLARMQGDIDSRRRSAFINEIKKDPRFRPSMLEDPKPRFQTVTLDGGPIIKSHNSKKTGLETAKPFKWGPLGGYY